MAPDEVFVVYNGLTDEIVSVHSNRYFADKMRLKLRHKLSTDDVQLTPEVIEMRYMITTLQEALSWIFDNKYNVQ